MRRRLWSLQIRSASKCHGSDYSCGGAGIIEKFTLTVALRPLEADPPGINLSVDILTFRI